MAKAKRWADPAQDGAPTVTVAGACRRLGYTRQGLHQNVAEGGLPAYLPTLREGEIVGWHRKEVGEREPYGDTMFYARDLDRWTAEHPRKNRYRSNERPAVYTEEEKARLLSDTKEIVKSGAVSSTDLFDLIREKYGVTARNAHVYRQARAVLLNAGVKIKASRRP